MAKLTCPVFLFDQFNSTELCSAWKIQGSNAGQAFFKNGDIQFIIQCFIFKNCKYNGYKDEYQSMQCKGKNHYWGKILKQFLIGFQVRQKNFSLPRKAKGRYLQVTFQLQNTQGCWKMKVRLVFAHFRIEVSVSFYMYVYLSRLCSNRARWPVAPNFCSRATRKSLPFHRNHMLGTLDFTSSEHWAPFNFPQSTALFMYNCFSGEDCCSVSDTGGSYKNSSTPRIGVEPIRFWLLVQMFYH